MTQQCSRSQRSTLRRAAHEPDAGGEGQKCANSQVAAVSFDAFGGAEAFAVVGVAHAGVAVAFAGCSQDQKDEEKNRSKQTVDAGGVEASASTCDGPRLYSRWQLPPLVGSP